MRGYKAFDQDLKCRGMQYEVGKTFRVDGKLRLCSNGLHFCEKLANVFDFYQYGSRVCEVDATGDIITEDGKSCTNELTVLRELSESEIRDLSNSGSRNSGSRNSGNRNSGNSNSGNWNSGDLNSGNRNSGNSNSGNWNSGNWNSGDLNSGNWNSGKRNSGNWNSGDWNLTNYSSGVLCTEEPECLIFDQPSGMTLAEWRESDAAKLMSQIYVATPLWIYWNDLSDSERELRERLKCQGGMLIVPEECGKPDFTGWWESLTSYEREVIKQIPNFDSVKWEKITGIHVED